MEQISKFALYILDWVQYANHKTQYTTHQSKAAYELMQTLGNLQMQIDNVCSIQSGLRSTRILLE